MPRQRSLEPGSFKFRRGRKGSAKTELTDELVSSLERRPKEYSVRDYDRGFAARVRPSGQISLTYRTRSEFGPPRRISFGKFPEDITVAEARLKIRHIEDCLISDEASPNELFSARTSINEVANTYLRHADGKFRDSYLTKVRRAFTRVILPGLGKISIGKLTPADVWAVLPESPLRTATQHHHYRMVSAFLTWAARRGIIERNILKGTTPPPRIPPFTAGREKRHLSMLELLEINSFAEDLPQPWPAVFHVMIFTGFTAEEVLGLLRSDVDFSEGTYLRVKHARAAHAPPVQLGNLATSWLRGLDGNAKHLFTDIENGMPLKMNRKVHRALIEAWGRGYFSCADITRAVNEELSTYRLNLPEWEVHLEVVAKAGEFEPHDLIL